MGSALLVDFGSTWMRVGISPELRNRSRPSLLQVHVPSCHIPLYKVRNSVFWLCRMHSSAICLHPYRYSGLLISPPSRTCKNQNAGVLWLDIDHPILVTFLKSCPGPS